MEYDLFKFTRENLREKLQELQGKTIKITCVAYKFSATVKNLWIENDYLYLNLDKDGFCLKIELPKEPLNYEKNMFFCEILINGVFHGLLKDGITIIS
jgi:hypothetical protein